MQEIQRIIIKIGSSSLILQNRKINEERIHQLIEQISILMKEGKEVLLVTSGAIAIGMERLGLTKKPKDIPLKQACAALGQVHLMEAYEKAAEKHHLLCAQILVNHDDFEDRKRMIHFSNTLEALFKNHVLPIVNENDALAVEEIKVGDNDTLASLLVPMIQAQLLILFSDIEGLFNKNPKENPDATFIPVVKEINENIEQMVGNELSSVGTGGMATKLKAARIATFAGASMRIAHAKEVGSLEKMVHGMDIGTLFLPSSHVLPSRNHWLIYKTHAKGTITVDDGAKAALLKERKSLLPGGIFSVDGSFLAESVVFIMDENKHIFAKGITRYSSDEIKLIKGKNTKEIEKILGYSRKQFIIHANDLILLEGENYGRIE